MLAGMHRPSPRRLSQVFMRGQDGQASARNRTALLAFFGQVVSSEVVMASESGCPIEMHRIEVDRCDEMYDKECKGGRFIPFHRASYDRSTGISPNSPREQVSSATSSLLVFIFLAGWICCLVGIFLHSEESPRVIGPSSSGRRGLAACLAGPGEPRPG